MTRDLEVAAAAIVLAGGRGSRLGGVRKADLVVGGRRLLDVVLDACAGCAPIVVVGEEDLGVREGVLHTREDPPFSGPAAGLAAGSSALHDGERAVPEWVLCLGCDQPGAPVAVPALRRAAAEVGDDVDAISASAADAAPPASPQLREVWCRQGTTPPEVRNGPEASRHRIEWTLAALRTDALGAAIAAQGGADGVVDLSMRRLLGSLRWAHAPVPAGITDDIDTWEDHARWLQRAVTI